MRFYYISIISVFLLIFIWAAGTGLLVWLGSRLRKTRKRIWPVMVPLFLILYIGPISEELWIAWNFGQACRKDAGIFIYKTVEVEGFYDDTTHWWRQLAESEYQFIESRERGPNMLWRVERDGDKLKHFKIDNPTARYHYKRLADHLQVAHGIKKFDRAVVDSSNNEILGRYLDYSRKAPWFFIHLDRPVMSCSEAKESAHEMGNPFSYRMVLIPKQSRN